MHRIIESCMIGRMMLPGEEIDHIDHDGLNNQVKNLRIVTRSENRCNQRTRAMPKSSKYKGVHVLGNKWCAQCGPLGSDRYIGCFDTEEDAARAYDHAARIVYGTFASLNFPGV
jgi:hypothetical protein